MANEQKSLTGVYVLLVIAAFLTAITMFSVFSLNSGITEEQVSSIVKGEISNIQIDVPTPVVESPQIDIDTLATQVASKLVVPEAQIDSDKLDKICEEIDCEGTELDEETITEVKELVENELMEDDEEEFFDMFVELMEVDEDYTEIKSMSLKDYEVKVLSEDDRDDENYKVSLFYRVKWEDSDSTDDVITYVLVKADVTEGEDVDFISMEKVERNFEFD